jgi:hypothetical protein
VVFARGISLRLALLSSRTGHKQSGTGVGTVCRAHQSLSKILILIPLQQIDYSGQDTYGFAQTLKLEIPIEFRRPQA